ncbi:hypothetical protein WG902_01800 [Ramlibacter sp. PS3R-8]|uniref:cupredoxin domain-containing protein n=1 Tax=Ramlibacter sp. PS3R-8 TaxID=3133437 RepID=UPI003099588C
MRGLAVVGALVLLALAAAAVVPPAAAAREELFEIPRGTWSQRMAGKDVAILPDTIHLTLGTRDVLLLRNADDVPQTFGPVLIMPGQSFRLPFEKSSTYHFACTAHANGQLTIVVDPPLTPGWSTLQWRWRQMQKLMA